MTPSRTQQQEAHRHHARGRIKAPMLAINFADDQVIAQALDHRVDYNE